MNTGLWKKVVAMAFVSVLSVFTLTACETTEGLGDDIENAGDEVDEAL